MKTLFICHFELADVVRLTPNFTSRIDGSLVHPLTIVIEKIYRFYFATRLKIEALLLGWPINGI